MKKAGDNPENFSQIELYSFKKKAYSIVNYFMGKVQCLLILKSRTVLTFVCCSGKALKSKCMQSKNEFMIIY